METQIDQVKKLSRRKRLSCLGILVLLPVLCCCATYHIKDLNEFYLYAFGVYNYDRTVKKAPEFHCLNRKVMAQIPVYPGSVLEGGEMQEGSVPYSNWPMYFEPPALRACYEVDAPLFKVLSFYHERLTNNGWELIEDDTFILGRVYYKDSACVLITDNCGFTSSDQSGSQPLKYTLAVYHNLNVLLGFPGMPDGRCP